jgi:hypothetical protein
MRTAYTVSMLCAGGHAQVDGRVSETRAVTGNAPLKQFFTARGIASRTIFLVIDDATPAEELRQTEPRAGLPVCPDFRVYDHGLRL